MELQSTYEVNNKKIILTENVYARLLGMINMTAFSKQMVPPDSIRNGGYEYIVMLYGKITDNGDVLFSKVNDANYEVFDGKSKIQKELYEELISMLKRDEYNCCCYVHTHPYGKTESSRVFSDSDIDYYKTTFSSSSFSKAFGKEILNLGGMMSNSSSGLANEDDISFVYYNERLDRMEYLPNVVVRLGGREIPLSNIVEPVYFDRSNHIYNKRQLDRNQRYMEYDVDRTLLVVDDEFVMDDVDNSKKAK